MFHWTNSSSTTTETTLMVVMNFCQWWYCYQLNAWAITISFSIHFRHPFAPKSSKFLHQLISFLPCCLSALCKMFVTVAVRVEHTHTTNLETDKWHTAAIQGNQLFIWLNVRHRISFSSIAMKNTIPYILIFHLHYINIIELN